MSRHPVKPSDLDLDLGSESAPGCYGNIIKGSRLMEGHCLIYCIKCLLYRLHVACHNIGRAEVKAFTCVCKNKEYKNPKTFTQSCTSTLVIG